jgi:hypothetical protein
VRGAGVATVPGFPAQWLAALVPLRSGIVAAILRPLRPV